MFAVLLCASILAVACGDDDDRPAPDGTLTDAAASSTPTDTITGIEAVDRVLLVVERADPIAFEALLRPSSIPCNNELGSGGPPHCFNAPGRPPEGTPISVFPYDVCEREWQFDLTPFTTRMLERLGELYAVVRIEQFTQPATPEALPDGGYAILYTDANDFQAHALVMTTSGIIAANTICDAGSTAEWFLDEGPPFRGPEVILQGPAFE